MDLTKDSRWWLLKGDEAAGAVSVVLGQLAQAQTARLSQMLANSRLYGCTPSAALTQSGVYGQYATAFPGLRERMVYNAIRVGVNTVLAKVRKNRPRPYFLTSGGDVQQQRKAKRLNKFVEGIFYQTKMKRLGPAIFRDGIVWGDGILHVYSRDRQVCFERVLPSELWVDEIEAEACEPRSMHRVKTVDRQMLVAAFPEARQAILNVTSTTTVGQTVSDLVEVRESWHLPSGPKAKDGRHKITIAGAELLDEKWERSGFPFAFFKWNENLFGFWGIGAVEESQNLQIQLNKLLLTTYKSLHLAGSFKVLLENSSKVVSEHLTNDVGAIVRYTGTAPAYVTPPILPREIPEQVRDLIQRIFEIIGISQMSARAEKPAGLNSGIALREYKDETSERLATASDNYEEFHLDVARLALEEVRAIAEEHGGYEVQVPGRKTVEVVEWQDVALEDTEYTMQCFPVSSLPTDPAGRLQTVQELMQAGLLSPEEGNRLLNFPDLEAVESLKVALEDNVLRVLDAIWDDAEYEPPEPWMDLALCKRKVLEYLNRGAVQNLEPERMEQLLRWNSQLDELTAPPPEAGPMPPGAEAGPMAAPMAPPVSDLVPNVPLPGGAPAMPPPIA